MSIIHDFKSINAKLNRMEQKAEWDEKNPKVEPAAGQMVWHPQHGYTAQAIPLADWSHVWDCWKVKI